MPQELGPVAFRDIIAGALAATAAAPAPFADPAIDWLLHESRTLRHPVYRTERDTADLLEQAAAQLPLLTYEYDPQTTVISRIGELNTRDMLVMSVLSQAFFAAGCPADNTVRGDVATLGSIARQLGMDPAGSTVMIRTSIQRLATARVTIRQQQTAGETSTRAEVTIGFLGDYGWRERKQRGHTVRRDNFLQLAPTMAELIRSGQFTFLRAEVLRALRRQPLALKLYAWARTHRPDDRGRIFYGVAKLAAALGCSDGNSTRRRRKLLEAAAAVCAAAPDEFPSFAVQPGRRDATLVLRRHVRGGPRLA